MEGLGIATVYRNIKSLVDEGWLVAVELYTLGLPTQYPTCGVTTYPMIAEPPSEVGGVHNARLFPAKY